MKREKEKIQIRLVHHLVTEKCQEYNKSVFVRKSIVMTVISVDFRNMY